MEAITIGNVRKESGVGGSAPVLMVGRCVKEGAGVELGVGKTVTSVLK